jgi:hypothetical protein
MGRIDVSKRQQDSSVDPRSEGDVQRKLLVFTFTTLFSGALYHDNPNHNSNPIKLVAIIVVISLMGLYGLTEYSDQLKKRSVRRKSDDLTYLQLMMFARFHPLRSHHQSSFLPIFQSVTTSPIIMQENDGRSIGRRSAEAKAFGIIESENTF